MVFSYEEYEENIYEDYKEIIEEEKISKREAIARNFYDYDMLAKKSEIDKAMVFVIFSEIAVSHVKIFYNFKNHLEKTLNELDFKEIRQENKITSDQYSDLVSRTERVLQKLEKMPLDYFHIACWYYDELVEEVQQFYDNLMVENGSVDSIVTSVLQRFDRDCGNTNSEKFIVYTTLAENLLNQGLTKVNGIEDVKHVLQSFDIEDVTDEQLTEDEQEKLAVRIRNVLFKLK